MAKRGWPSSSCLVLAKKACKNAEGRSGLLFLLPHCRRIWLCSCVWIDYRSQNSLVGGTTWLWQLLEGIWSWRRSGVASGKQYSVGRGVAAPDLGLYAPDRLFLGMWFVPQEPVYLHNSLRGQLAQHLEENGVVGSLKKDLKFEGLHLEDQLAGKESQLCPFCLISLEPLICKVRTL